MAFTLNFGNIAKRRNSTYVPTAAQMANELSVVLKDGCSDTAPVFLISAAAFPYNYVQWGNRYYFITDIEYTRNNLFTVSCTIDALATFKAAILASTQFVAYSSVSGGTWLADTRLPILNSREYYETVVTPSYFSEGGHYMLSVLGKSGCNLFSVTEAQISQLIDSVQQSVDDVYDDIINNMGTPEEIIAESLLQTDVLGNAFANAPTCIRSCYWVPFNERNIGAAPVTVYLGNFDAGFSAYKQQITPTLGQLSAAIPWKYSDWRRVNCENISVYLPFVGVVNIPSETICNEEYLTIQYSFTLSDGAISYLIYAGQLTTGKQPIAVHSASCSINYPLGINQQASAGDVINTALAGATRTASAGLGGLVPTIATGVSAVQTGYEILDKMFSTNPSCIGGMGGGAGSNFSKDIKVMNTVHPSMYEPSIMQPSMGVPTMQPLQLSACSGYCQCINAHVPAAAEVSVLNEIDMFLNSGFYIE